MSTEVARARRIETPLWINGRTLLGLLLFAIAFMSGQRMLASADDTVGVWAAARDLPVGEGLGPADLEQIQVQMPDDLLSRYATSLDRLDGGILLHPLHAGELIALNGVGTGPAAISGRSLTIPVSPEHSAGGRLQVGDRIDVFATFDAGDLRARTVAVARAVEVLGTVDSGGLITGEEATVGITVAATPEEAARLAFAIRTGEIDLARIEAPTRPTGPQSITAGSFR